MNKDKGQWSDSLRKATREALENYALVGLGDALHFKHIGSAFGVIAIADILGGQLKLIDKNTNEETTFASSDALIDAGWVID